MKRFMFLLLCLIPMVVLADQVTAPATAANQQAVIASLAQQEFWLKLIALIMPLPLAIIAYLQVKANKERKLNQTENRENMASMVTALNGSTLSQTTQAHAAGYFEGNSERTERGNQITQDVRDVAKAASVVADQAKRDIEKLPPK